MESGNTVAVRSIDPASESAVAIEFGAEGVTVTPETAVVSFGLPPEAERPEPGTVASATEWGLEGDGTARSNSLERYGNAFESTATDETWATESDGITTAVDAGTLAGLHHRLHRGGWASGATCWWRSTGRGWLVAEHWAVLAGG